MSTPPLAGGAAGPNALRPLVGTVLDALHDGAADRIGPLPPGGPEAVAVRVRATAHPVLPDTGTGAEEALRTLVHAITEGAADPADPLRGPSALPAARRRRSRRPRRLRPQPLDGLLGPGPAASELEALVTRAIAAEIYPAGDALVTTGGSESNQLALLLARERHGAVRIVCGANAHHSLHRAAWLLGLPEPLTVPSPSGTIDLAALDEALTATHGPVLVAATAGTTDAGLIDPLPEIADLCDRHGAELHIDAAYGGPLLFSDLHRPLLAGLERAHSVTLDLHKLGWQPVAAGLLAVPCPTTLDALTHQADYLNADDDTEAGLPDLLGRSLRTTRRPDVFKIAVTLRALGRSGLAALIDRTCAIAAELADLVEARPGLELYDRPTISTVLFRPTGADDATVAAIRRTLLTEGHAVLGRARADNRLWLKATLLNPHATTGDLEALLKLLEGSTPR